MDNGAINYRRFRDKEDKNALIEIIKEYKDGLMYFLYSIVRDINVAEDLTEDTFVLLGTKKPKDKQDCSFKTWLYTIGRNLAIDYLRKSARHSLFNISDYPDLISPEAEPEISFILEERKQILYHSIERLNPEYRQILWLVYFENLSHKECSVIMKKNVHNIETLVYRARQALKKQLEQDGFIYENI